MTRKPRFLFVGASGSSHIGGSLMRAAADLDYDAQLADASGAWRLGTIRQKVLWYLDRRPITLERFSHELTRKCAEMRPDIIIATGAAPVTAGALEICRSHGAKLLNFSTDDPFNPRHRSRWFLDALRSYDTVFTPRRANIDDLRNHGCRRIEYLPFGYDPHLFYPPGQAAGEERSDLFFAGTADSDRLPYAVAAIRAGLNVRLHGNYWGRYQQTRKIARGQADLPTVRAGVAGCRVALCLVRHENRDGHSMRSFEVPAIGACMVVEDTPEHREIFGAEGENVVYFRTPAEMLDKTRELLNDGTTRYRLRQNAHAVISQGHNTYADRLRTMTEPAL